MCEKSVWNEVQNVVTGEGKGATRMTVDGIHAERLVLWVLLDCVTRHWNGLFDRTWPA
jgi:hypothetical protein